MPFTAVERDESGYVSRTNVSFAGENISITPTSKKGWRMSKAGLPTLQVASLKAKSGQFFTSVFLPTGYPATVSPDYLQYQVFNAIQAFCSSVAGLIASRGVLEGLK
ncbi:hypothetical protein BJ138DRAFT_787345 [Hygrophoropsis aurantiaca]|uniref:Uncharacterized protein n=1 Tax=Hygrophoropsis aurantiaca TaxID=72124 RepID=A0ACB7ZW13_9AGAM|nr:hypothetical protein BJ138DRAFT_787345 [Hygrophoropsis aurantiaca]